MIIIFTQRLIGVTAWYKNDYLILFCDAPGLLIEIVETEHKPANDP